MPRRLLSDISVVAALTTTSPTYDDYVVIGDGHYNTHEWSGFIAALRVTAHSGTTPTLDIRIEHSVKNPDSAGYSPFITLKDFTQVTTTDSVTHIFVPDATIIQFGRAIRFLAKVGGTSPSYTFDIDIGARE